MVQMIEVVAVIWVLSLASSLFFVTILKLLKKKWAEDPLVICLILFFGIPFSLVIAFILGLTDIFTNFLENLIN